MQVYMVGGAVRDKLLHRPIKDKDFVVVGATPKQMLDVGFTQVGADFPVFLHPTTKAEYALARTERKSGKGYKGFSVYAAPEVTLEQDLQRRDLTMNAMAIAVRGLFDDTPITGQVIDPYGGLADLNNKVLRHVSAAFSEDPLRVLRIARFYGRFYDPNSHKNFTIADETRALIGNILAAGELQQLTPERVWHESARAIMQPSPQAYFECLLAVGALEQLMPALAVVLAQPPVQALTFKALAIAGQQNASLCQRWALLMSSFAPIRLTMTTGPAIDLPVVDLADTTVPAVSAPIFDDPTTWLSHIRQMGELLKAPKKVTQFASLYANTHALLANFANLSADDVAVLLQITKAHKNPEDMHALIATHHHLQSAYQHMKLEQLIAAYNSVTMRDIDADLHGSAIGAALDNARLARVAAALST